MNFAIVMEGMTLIAFMVMLAGGKQKRERGWKVLSGMLVLVALIQCAGMALIVSVRLCFDLGEVKLRAKVEVPRRGTRDNNTDC